jgi:hypothetical protein
MPGWRDTGAQPIRRVPIAAYTGQISNVPLTGGQVQAKAGGATLTLTVGPQGLGTVWYPVQVTLSTSIGQLDTCTGTVYLGPQAIPISQVGAVFSGNGTVALAIPSMSPGQLLTIQWTNATAGELCSANVIGTMSALSTQ